MRTLARIRAVVGSELPKPGSVRHSLAVLGAVAVAAEVLLALADGAAAAATGLALITAVALALGRYAVAGDRDSVHRGRVRLLDGRAPTLGGWRRIVVETLAGEGEAPLDTVMRPQLQRLFAARLADRHGVVMHRNPQRARALVGAELWPWIDPGATAPEPMLPEPVLRSLLDCLEAL